jgi:hypothetical protein
MMRGNQMARALCASKGWGSLWTVLRQNITTREEFAEKLSSKKYREILGTIGNTQALRRTVPAHFGIRTCTEPT